MIRYPEWKARTVLAALVLPPLLWVVSFAWLVGWIDRQRPFTQGGGLVFESASDDPTRYRVIASFPEAEYPPA